LSFNKANIGLGLIIVALGMSPGLLIAQFYDNPGLGQKPVAGYPQDYKPLGIRAGAFMLHPGVQLAAEFTDNVFFTRENKQSDTIFHIRPYISAQSTWSKHSLNIRLAADIARYADFDFRDYEDYFFTVNGRVDVKNRSFLSYGGQIMNLHEGLNDRDSEQGFEPTRYWLYGANLGYDHTFNRLSLGVALTWNRLDFDNAYSLKDGVINNQDRDRDTYRWSARAGYQFSSGMQAFASYASGTVKYDEDTDRNDYQRSGDAYRLAGGVRANLTGKLNGDVSVNYVSRSYDDPLLPDTSGWGLGAGLGWTPTYLTTVYVRADTSVQETTSEYASGYLRTLYSVRVDHELTRFLQINGFASYSDNDYQLIAGAPPDARAWDKVYRYGVGLSWFINRHLFLNASYDYAKLKTNVPEDGYNVNTVWLTLGIER
jgi:hypothetical protein